MLYIIYADGACSGNPGPGGWAFDTYGQSVSDATRIASGAGSAGHSTNNIMELEALKAALSDLARRSPGRVELRLDSEYVLKGLFEWMPGWRRRGWTAASGKPVANRDLWVALASLHDQLVSGGFALAPKWVRGHSGEPWNERVDRIACGMRDQAGAGGSGKPASAPPTPGADAPGRNPGLCAAIAAVGELRAGRISDDEAIARLRAISWCPEQGLPEMS